MSSRRERVFDRCELLANIGGDRELLHELFRLFLDRHRPLIQDIETAVHRGDSGALRLAAHTLKGMAENLCASTLVGVASELEAVGRRGNLDEGTHLLVDLQHAVQRLVEALKQKN
jgi:HPt (histidine-containing phosphotransfer) domain-containing protein